MEISKSNVVFYRSLSTTKIFLWFLQHLCISIQSQGHYINPLKPKLLLLEWKMWNLCLNTHTCPLVKSLTCFDCTCAYMAKRARYIYVPIWDDTTQVCQTYICFRKTLTITVNFTTVWQYAWNRAANYSWTSGVYSWNCVLTPELLKSYKNSWNCKIWPRNFLRYFFFIYWAKRQWKKGQASGFIYKLMQHETCKL